MRRSVHVQPLARFPRSVAGELEVSDARRQFLQCNATFQPRQRSAEAEVIAMAEGEVRIRVTRDVEALGISEGARAEPMTASSSVPAGSVSPCNSTSRVVSRNIHWSGAR